MKLQPLKTLLICLIFITFNSELKAFTLIIKSEVNLKKIKLFEHTSISPHKLSVGSNEIKLNNYPNALYLIHKKSRSKSTFLPMLWVASENSVIEITITENYEVVIKEESQHQLILHQIFKSSSNKHNLFPYTPSPDEPLEPILALEAKSLIQNLLTYTKRSDLEKLLALSKERQIDNWSTEVLDSYLKESLTELYAVGQLKKITALDNLENVITFTPSKEKHTLIAISGSWCGPCIKGIPRQSELYDEVKQKVNFVTLWDDPNLEYFTKNHRNKKKLISWTSLWDQYGLMASALQVKAYPTYILFNKEGLEVERWEGKLPNRIDKFLNE